MRRCSSALVTAFIAIALPTATLAAQTRPSEPWRGWLELDVGGAREDQGCSACLRNDALGGLAFSGAVGLALPNGFGTALVGRAFQEVSYEYSQRSRYLLALAQYSLNAAPWATMNAGVGWGTHQGSSAPYANDGSGAVLGIGLGIRVPASSGLAATVTADWLQSVSGARPAAGGRPESSFHPRLLTIGIGFSAATSRLDESR